VFHVSAVVPSGKSKRANVNPEKVENLAATTLYMINKTSGYDYIYIIYIR